MLHVIAMTRFREWRCWPGATQHRAGLLTCDPMGLGDMTGMRMRGTPGVPMEALGILGTLAWLCPQAAREARSPLSINTGYFWLLQAGG